MGSEMCIRDRGVGLHACSRFACSTIIEERIAIKLPEGSSIFGFLRYKINKNVVIVVVALYSVSAPRRV